MHLHSFSTVDGFHLLDFIAWWVSFPLKDHCIQVQKNTFKNVYFFTISSTHKRSFFLPSLPILCGIQDPEGCSLFAMLHAWLSSWFPMFDQVYLLSACFFNLITRYWVHKLHGCQWVELFTQKNIQKLWVNCCWDLVFVASSSVRLYGNCFIFNETFLSLELVLCIAFGSHLELWQEIWIFKILRRCQLKYSHS